MARQRELSTAIPSKFAMFSVIRGVGATIGRRGLSDQRPAGCLNAQPRRIFASRE